MAQKLIIVGDSSFAEIAYEYFTHDSDYDVVAFAVESAYKTRDTLFGLPIVDFETMQEHYAPEDHAMFTALTYAKMNRVRTRLYQEAKTKGYKIASYVSSRAFVWRNVSVGENVFIFEDNTVQPFCTIEDNVILWSGNHIGHHSIIRKNTFISSHVVVSGHCEIKQNGFIGVNVAIGNNLVIAEDNFFAQGSVVFKDTEADKMYFGNPAEPRTISALRYFKVDA